MTIRSNLAYVAPLLALVLTPLPAAASTVRIYVTNSAGDSIDVIDPVTNRVVQEIKDVVGAHGIAFSPDAKRVYVSNEETSTLDVFDRKSGKLIKKVALSDHPNNISVTKNGDRIVVAIARGKGGLDIVDAATLTLKQTISANGGRLHNVYVTPDNKYVVGGSIPSRMFYVFDLDKEQLAWAMPMDLGVRCMAIETNPDGSTKRVFVQLSTLNGYSVIDFGQQKEAARVTLPSVPQQFDHGGTGRTNRRTASALRRITRRCGSPAFPTMRCMNIPSPTSNWSARLTCPAKRSPAAPLRCRRWPTGSPSRRTAGNCSCRTRVSARSRWSIPRR